MLLLLWRSSSLQPHFPSPRRFSLALNLECQTYDSVCDSMGTNWCHKYIIMLFYGVCGCVWIESCLLSCFNKSTDSHSPGTLGVDVKTAQMSTTQQYQYLCLLKPYSDTPHIHSSWFCTSSGIVEMNRKCICGFKNLSFSADLETLDSWDSSLVVKFGSELCFSVWLTFVVAKTLKGNYCQSSSLWLDILGYWDSPCLSSLMLAQSFTFEISIPYCVSRAPHQSQSSGSCVFLFWF